MSSAILEQLPQILERFPSLSEINEEEWNKEGISVQLVEPNFTIEEGKFLEFASFIMDGTIRMYKLSAGGREITLYRIRSGECCPLMTTSILGETEYEATACVEEPARILIIPVPVFRDWMDRYSGFRQFIFRSLAKRIISMSNLLDNINFKSIRGRVSEYLIEATQSTGDTLQTTHDVLSVELGTAREVVSRTLKALEKEGLLKLSRGKIKIIDRNRLEQYIEL